PPASGPPPCPPATKPPFAAAATTSACYILRAAHFSILCAANWAGGERASDMVRLKDIANRAGVSVMTVSKVMRDAPDISANTKARIRALAQQMGYVPDSLAQGLRTRTTKLFGLVISAMTNPIFARVVMAIEERAHELGYEVILSHTLNIPEREDAAVRRLISRRVDGLF